jgi:hypothetical protein
MHYPRKKVFAGSALAENHYGRRGLGKKPGPSALIAGGPALADDSGKGRILYSFRGGGQPGTPLEGGTHRTGELVEYEGLR